MMLLYTETARLRPSSLKKHKTNLYFKEIITVNKDPCSLLIEHVATTSTLNLLEFAM